jgi:diguanylate cyclase (GGDEF)-like protein
VSRLRPVHAIAVTAIAVATAARPPSALALDPARAITQYVHDTWQAPRSLPQNSVSAIVQTRDGYLWLGTVAGLVRFDGVRSVVFDKANTPALANHRVTSLMEDRDGRLWIGTMQGLARRDGERMVLFTTKEGLPHDIVTALYEDRVGRILVGTRGGGIVRFKDDRFVRESGFEATAGLRVKAILEDPSGTLWVGTETGLVRIKDGQATVLTKKDGLAHDRILSLAGDGKGALWIGTEGGGLIQSKEGRFEAITTKQGLSNDNVWSLGFDHQGSLWIGTDGGGLDRLASGRLSSFTTRQGLGSDFVWAIREDREGSLWVGTNGGGLSRFKDGPIAAFGTREGLSSDFVRAVYRTHDGALWIGTYGSGVNRIAEGRITQLTTRDGLSNDSVVSLLESRDGSLWIGTRYGLNRLKDGRITVTTQKDGLSNDFIYALHEDAEGALWIGTNGGGLDRLKDGKITSLTTRQGLTSDVVTTLLGARDGSLWMGTYGGGAMRLQSGALTGLATKDGLSSNSVIAMREDDDGTLWIATAGGGLNRVRDGRVSAVTTRQGLLDDDVLGLLPDSADHFWLAGVRGLSRVDRREVEDVLDGRRPALRSVGYGVADGMRNAEGNGGSPAAWRDTDGRLWFATMGGAVVVDPTHLSPNAMAPPVAIEEALADESRLSGDGGWRLPPGTRRLELHYTALSLRDPSRVAFKFRLDGFDRDWIDAGQRRVAYYTNLAHGDYRFRVIAANEDGVWNESGASLAFTVEPRLVERGWFRVLALLVFGVSLVGLDRLRARRARVRERELVALVDERTARLRLANEELERLATLDGLTRIANRRAFDEALPRVWADHRRRGAPLAIVLCDIDHFKRYNDRHGHPAGDEALITVAAALAGVTRRASDLVARYGGEEIVFLLPDTDAEGARQVATAALDAVRTLKLPHGDPEAAPFVTVSLGLAATVPSPDSAPADLVASADRALYRAKAAGRDRVDVETEGDRHHADSRTRPGPSSSAL